MTTTKNIVNCCLFFLGAMLSLSGFYVTLNANFLALSHLIYTVTSVSFLFLTIKISGGNEQPSLMGNAKTYVVSFVVTLMVFYFLFTILKHISLVNLQNYLTIALMLFVVGVFTILSRKNIIAILMGTQLIIFSAALNFVAYSKNIDGERFTFFIVLMSIVEIVVALAIVNRFFLIKKSINIDDAAQLKN